MLFNSFIKGQNSRLVQNSKDLQETIIIILELSERVKNENTMGKEENADYQHWLQLPLTSESFSPFPHNDTF